MSTSTSAKEEENLKSLWIGHGFPAADKLYQIAKSKSLNVKLSEVKEFIKEQEVSQLHKQPTKEAEIPITVDGNNNEFQLDLLDESAFATRNQGYRWILILQDIWSRKAAGVKCKTKSPNDVIVALKEAIASLGKPIQIVSDSGNEFKGAVADYFKEQNIAHRTVEVGTHTSLGIIDSFAKFVKNSLHKKFTHAQNTNWTEYLPTLIKNFNETPHPALKAKGEDALTPNEGVKFETDVRNINIEKVEKAEAKRKPSELQVGDHVRVLKKKSTFDRGYEIRYSIEVFTIKSIDGHWYELNNGKKYREGSLQKIKAKPIADKVEEIEDVAKHDKFDHQTSQILKHKEGVSQTNVTRQLRERRPENMVIDSRFGKINW